MLTFSLPAGGGAFASGLVGAFLSGAFSGAFLGGAGCWATAWPRPAMQIPNTATTAARWPNRVGREHRNVQLFMRQSPPQQSGLTRAVEPRVRATNGRIAAIP